MTKSDVDIYIDYCDYLADCEAKFKQISEAGIQPPLIVLYYPGTPEPGYLVALTYGLSLVPHPEWQHGTVELMLCVRSDDVIWALALGEIAYRLRGKCPFAYGDTVRFGTAMTKESDMDAFVANYPFSLDPEDLHIDLSNRFIHITQVYPIYLSEVDLVHSKGVDWLFGNKDFDPSDVQRQPVHA